MRRSGYISLAILVLCAACGGARRLGHTPQAGQAKPSLPPSGLPTWVDRGSTAENSETGRVFWGVGSGHGIRNPALLRTAADNRARAEIAKVLKVFTSSLMKDFLASDSQQNVEQVIKTMTARSLKGVRIVDRYIDGNGTMYALASMSLEDVRAVLAAQRAGVVKNHAMDSSLESIFDENAKRFDHPSQSEMPSIVGEVDIPVEGSSDSVTDSAGVVVRKGGRPLWLSGTDPAYPAADYLCGVGYGSERLMAENAAFAALSRIFAAHVRSAAEDFIGAYAKTGAEELETRSVEMTTKVSTDRVLKGVELQDVWESSHEQIYALACLRRGAAAQALQDQIRIDDARIASYLDKARQVDKASRVAQLGRALDALVGREGLNAELRIIDPRGIGVPGQFSHANVAVAFEAAVESLKVAVVVTGPMHSELRAQLSRALSSMGYDVRGHGATDVDVLVTAKAHFEDAGTGRIADKQVYFARAIAQVEVTNQVTGGVLTSFVERHKDGSRTASEARSLALRRLGVKVVRLVRPEIDAAMKGH